MIIVKINSTIVIANVPHATIGQGLKSSSSSSSKSSSSSTRRASRTLLMLTININMLIVNKPPATALQMLLPRITLKKKLPNAINRTPVQASIFDGVFMRFSPLFFIFLLKINIYKRHNRAS